VTDIARRDEEEVSQDGVELKNIGVPFIDFLSSGTS